MKQIFIALISGILILTACGQTSAEDVFTTPISATETSTVQSVISSPVPSKTPRERANVPTSTPRLLTPLPAIPTFTPTFDALTIVTVTPAPPTACPEENSEIVADFPIPEDYHSAEILDEILMYLNSGGTLDQPAMTFSTQDPDSNWGKIIDLNGDGVNESVYREWIRYDILCCKGGRYQNLFNSSPHPQFTEPLTPTSRNTHG